MLSAPPDTASASRGKRTSGAKAARASLGVIGSRHQQAALRASPLRGGGSQPEHGPAAREAPASGSSPWTRGSASSPCGGASCCGAPAPPSLRLERAELLRHQLELARQRADLRLKRIDPGSETRGMPDSGPHRRRRFPAAAAHPVLPSRAIRARPPSLGDRRFAAPAGRSGPAARQAPQRPHLRPAAPAAVRPGARPVGRDRGWQPREAEATLPPIRSPSAIGCAQSKSKRSRG